jgi:hypothetical protein
MERTFSLPAFLSFIIPGVGQLIKKQFIKTVNCQYCHLWLWHFYFGYGISMMHITGKMIGG